jgi:hypothetical protein
VRGEHAARWEEDMQEEMEEGMEGMGRRHAAGWEEGMQWGGGGVKGEHVKKKREEGHAEKNGRGQSDG